MSIGTCSGGEPDADVSSPSRPDEGMGKAKGEDSHHVHDSDVKLNEEKMEINSGLNYFTAKAAANHRRGRTRFSYWRRRS
jgi:hypothetical protein